MPLLKSNMSGKKSWQTHSLTESRSESGPVAWDQRHGCIIIAIYSAVATHRSRFTAHFVGDRLHNHRGVHF